MAWLLLERPNELLAQKLVVVLVDPGLVDTPTGLPRVVQAAVRVA
jgi:hypothetical protein